MAGWLDRRFDRVAQLGPAVSLVRDRLGPEGASAFVLKRPEPGARGSVEALAREASELGRLAHPALRPLVAREGDAIVLEHVTGSELGEHLRAHPGDVTRVAVSLLRVLVYVHGRGLVHGDLKPSNVLVDVHGAVRLIDLGLAVPIGAAPRGGSAGFLAPEYARGRAASVAGDLYSLGATLRASGARTATELVAACLADDPAQRPASADAALALLDRTARPLDRAGRLPRVGDGSALALAADAVRALEGATVVVRAAPGAGRSRLARECVSAVTALSGATLAGGHDPLAALDAIGGLAAAARDGLPIVLDDADQASAKAATSLVAAARTLAQLERGALVVVGANDELARALVAAGAREVAPVPIGLDEARQLSTAAGARADDAALRAIVAAAEGRAGAVAHVLVTLGEHPGTPLDALCEQAARCVRVAPTGAISSESPEQALAAAAADLDARAEQRAARRLRAAFPEPVRDPRAVLLLAQAEARSGQLARAVERLGTLGDTLAPDAQLERARWLERLGRYAEARTQAEHARGALSAPALRACASVVAAGAARALGDGDAAETIAAAAVPDADAADAARLWSIRSDAALVRGDTRAALAHAREAERAARAIDAPGLVAQALSRAAAAHALGGEPARARELHAAAMRAAEESADPAGLPPYVMNVATAEHAAGELATAIERYEEAARLAEQFGRTATRAAALTNLGGLLAGLGANDEAAHVLDAAAAAAESSGAAIYATQVLLIRAELEGRTSPSTARERARAARDAFRAQGAERQALEAELLDAELAVDAGDPSVAAAFCATHRGALAEAGLAARASRAHARAALGVDDLDTARRHAELAVELARRDGDRELGAHALGTLALTHDRLGTGAGDAYRARAREAVGEVAARLPPGLRERWLSGPARPLAATPSVRPPTGGADADDALGHRARRLLALVRRVLLEGDEARLLGAAVDEAVALTRAERAFLLRKLPSGRTDVTVARNLDRESIRRSRFSASVAERVITTGEPLVTASAADDPELQGVRSVLDLGLRSILCVPVRGPDGVIGALYLDHRFEVGQFGPADVEIVQSLADILGVALENARLHREAATRAETLSRAHEQASRESAIRALELDRLASVLATQERQHGGATLAANDSGIVGSSPALARALDTARRVAPSDLPVLVQGESGTGKELFARYIHGQSLRRNGPFVAINCGAIPETLLESELFGHVRGAFTGALRDHPGLFRAADGGTLLLDEIGEMPVRMQTRLLRVLQEHEVRPVGGGDPVRVDVRVLAATNRDLAGDAEAGRFRRDLYFRLVGVCIDVPALRDRREDVVDIARAALERIAREPGMRKVRIGRDAIQALLAHEWPGNVRELEQALRRAVLSAEGDELRAEDLALGVPAAAPSERRVAHRALDRVLVDKALRGARGNRTAAARALGVSRVTLHRWIKRYGLQ